MSADQVGRLCNASRDFDVFVFAANPDPGNAKPKRAKLSPEKRKKADVVRKVHACLRCRLLKVPCDEGSPCSRCLSLVVTATARKTLSFSECIRSRIKDINIYANGFELSFSPAEPSIQELGESTNVNIEFSTEIVDNNDLQSVLGLARSWIVDAKNPKETTLVDTLSSPTVKSIIADALGPETAAVFQQMLLATPFAHGYSLLGDSESTDTMQSMWRTGHSSGSSVLERLDDLLRPTDLARLSSIAGQALFIVLLGMIITIDYSSAVVQPALSAPDSERLNTDGAGNFWELMRQHLRQMLGHYLVFVGSRAGLRFEPEVERKLLQSGLHGLDDRVRILWTNRARGWGRDIDDPSETEENDITETWLIEGGSVRKKGLLMRTR
ncbi:hypothetical protein B0H66DRAFT_606491 [Apodospora peruviana]|uniref:Zn(2)-C6 fungal-type domain-containing protein n=1 Tax=Apodospora peruviana TaxID=516989 RepID=A0AAE0HZZ9_9PEZI|nr:hypothetical protein B0H66DRAFT_606491 [Apodospora peruviana]